MKSFLKNALGGEQKGKDPNSLVGKVIQCSQFNVICEETIGAGGFASIYRVRDQPTGQTYALKHLRLPQDSDAVADVRQEMRTMAHLGSHPNILKLHAASFAGPAGKETDAFMVMDFAPITLLDMMQRSNFQLDEFFVHEVFSEMCHAVAHMHTFNPPYAHRDIKAENVLKTTRGKWVLCDFGSATTKAQVFETPAEIAMEEDVVRRTTTPAYRAPEMWDIMSRQRIDTKVDIWALGVLLYVLVFGKLPFQGDSKLSVLFGKYEMPPGKNPLMCDLIKDLLTTDPAARPDILTVLGRLDNIKQSLLHSVASSPVAAPLPPVMPQQPPQLPAQNVPPHHAPGHKVSASFDAVFDEHPGSLPGYRAASVTAALAAGQQPQPTHAAAPAVMNGIQRMSPAPAMVAQQQQQQQQQQQPPSQPLQRAPGGHYPTIPGHSAASTSSVVQSGLRPIPETGASTAAIRTARHPSPALPAQTAPGKAPSRNDIRMAAATPLFVPSEGALQIATPGGPMPSAGSFTNAPPKLQEPPQPSQPLQPPTTTLIEVDHGPPGDVTQSLLGGGFSPVKRGHGGHHRHKKSSSFSQDLLSSSAADIDAGSSAGGAPSFKPDWGDAPAFGGASDTSVVATSGQGPSRLGASSSLTAAVPALPKQPAPASMASAPHPSPSVITQRLSESGPGSSSSQNPGGRVSPAGQPRGMPRVVEGPPEGPAAKGVQGHGHASAPPANNLELDTLRIQVKGLTSTHASLLSRVKQLEDLVSEQAALLVVMQQQLGLEGRLGSSTAGSATAAASQQQLQAGNLRRRPTEGALAERADSSTSTRVPSNSGAWHAFDADPKPAS